MLARLAPSAVTAPVANRQTVGRQTACLPDQNAGLAHLAAETGRGSLFQGEVQIFDGGAVP